MSVFWAVMAGINVFVAFLPTRHEWLTWYDWGAVVFFGLLSIRAAIKEGRDA